MASAHFGCLTFSTFININPDRAAIRGVIATIIDSSPQRSWAAASFPKNRRNAIVCRVCDSAQHCQSK
jgi:hypothetical protein